MPPCCLRYLPWDIILKILYLLPLKSLLRSRIVSKAWRDFIDNPDLTKKYLHKSTRQRNLILCNHDDKSYVELFRLKNRNITRAIPLHYLPSNDDYYAGCCDGLFCLWNFTDHTFILSNPSNMTYQKLPKLGDFFVYFPHGFGYDAINDDYKVVGLIRNPGIFDSSFWYYVVNIYSLKSGSWTTSKQVIPYEICCSQKQCGIFVGNALHWLGKSDKNTIIAFDVVTEKHRELPKPNRENIDGGPIVDVLGGNLCFLSTNRASSCVDMWMMKEYGVESSWTNLLSISYSSLGRYISVNDIRPLVYSICGKKVLLRVHGEICWYDFENDVKSIVEIQPKKAKIKVCEAYVCFDSLIPLKDSINTSQTTQAKGKES